MLIRMNRGKQLTIVIYIESVFQRKNKAHMKHIVDIAEIPTIYRLRNLLNIFINTAMLILNCREDRSMYYEKTNRD